MSPSPSEVDLANEQVPIVTALRLAGCALPEDIGYAGRNRKLRCPFGQLYHSDHGVAAAMRLYLDDNHAWCFSCAMYYTPVKVAAQAWGVDWVTAARRLLDLIGYQPPGTAQQWSHAAGFEPAPDTAMLAEALKTYCRRVCDDWATVQFTAPVAGVLGRCLRLLAVVRTGEDARQWLDGCKTAMKQILDSKQVLL